MADTKRMVFPAATPAMDDTLHLGLAASIAEAGNSPFRFAVLFERGHLSMELYAPQERDVQTAHGQDELYVVVSGSGTFCRSTETVAFSSGDALFVAAGVYHRFETFTDDFRAWAMFFGPSGGCEAALSSHSRVTDGGMNG